MNRTAARVIVACRVVVIAIAQMVAVMPSEASAQNPALNPYIDFLKTQSTSAKDYILGLFDTHDMVILCERDHRDVTQYDLYLDVIRDKRFVETVGNVFTEVGVSNLNPALNEFLHTDGLPPDSAEQAIRWFIRNGDWIPLWEKQNWPNFMRSIYDLNQTLPPEQKIALYPSDLPFDWSTMDSAKLADFQPTLDSRDSVMAKQVIDGFARIMQSDSPRKKALVIMNYRHAFNRDTGKPGGTPSQNVGRYLFEEFGDRVANAYVNFARFVRDSITGGIVLKAIQDGQWDAAFESVSMEDAGFDFAGSPFGEDLFDIWPYPIDSLRYKDVFNGFVFYLPIRKFRNVIGMPGIVDSAFAPEFQRRIRLERLIAGEDPTDLPSLEQMMRDYNTVREFAEQNLDSIEVQIDQWLR